MNNKILKFSTSIIFIGACIGWVIYTQLKIIQLKTNFKLTTGIVDHLTPPTYKNNSRGVSYHYVIEGKRVLGETSIKVCENFDLTSLSHLLVNQEYPVAYDSNDVSSSTLILTIKEANKFKCNLNQNILRTDSILNCYLGPENY